MTTEGDLKLIYEVCSRQERCIKCPFINKYNGACSMYGFPEHWNVDEIKRVLDQIRRERNTNINGGPTNGK